MCVATHLARGVPGWLLGIRRATRTAMVRTYQAPRYCTSTLPFQRPLMHGQLLRMAKACQRMFVLSWAAWVRGRVFLDRPLCCRQRFGIRVRRVFWECQKSVIQNSLSLDSRSRASFWVSMHTQKLNSPASSHSLPNLVVSLTEPNMGQACGLFGLANGLGRTFTEVVWLHGNEDCPP